MDSATLIYFGARTIGSRLRASRLVGFRDLFGSAMRFNGTGAGTASRDLSDNSARVRDEAVDEASLCPAASRGARSGKRFR